ncbi:trigger factor [Candidatus Saccharibacteria bacterium]|nr:MAG: trigger factor [Candidatus Saccharibacteria bacterium]
MQITKKQLNPTTVQLTITAGSDELAPAKQVVLTELAKEVKLAGFRKGHAPAAMVEKVVDQQLLQNKVIDHVVNELYTAGLEQEKLRPVAQPEVSLTKFVPFTTLEMNATVEVVGEVKLPDYKKFKVEKKVAAVTDAEIEAVVDDLLARSATKNEVKRAAADGDEVTIDFAGVDAKSQEEIEGAKGEDYPLVLGSNTFIPGFEPELLGLKAGDAKTFDVTFPKDYGAAQLQNKKVTFTVTVKLVKERVLPKLDAAFAASVGPFKSVAELRTDIRKQMGAEKEREAQAKLESDVLEQLGQKAQIAMPDSLVEQEIDRMDEEEKRNLMYRGQTWQEHLKAEGKTEEEHRESHREQAALRVKTGIALGEVAEKEGVRVSQEEFDARLSELKKQYTDQQMLTELEKPENKRDILSRMLTEKTIATLVSYTVKKN